jgi:YD repeat-containing protein
LNLERLFAFLPLIFGGSDAADPGPISTFSSPIVGAQSLSEVGCQVIPVSRTLGYSYDRLHRLTTATYPAAGAGQPARIYGYAYDPAGNRTGQTINGVVTSYQYDAANRLTQAAVSGQPSAVVYTYDNNGNLLNDGLRTYAYDAANRLISVTQGVTTTQFGYK